MTFWVYEWSGDFQDASFTLKRTWDFPILWALQGGRLVDNLLYLVTGPSMNCIHIFNIMQKELVGIIDLTRDVFGITNEAQGFDWDGIPYITSTNSTSHKWWLHELHL